MNPTLAQGLLQVGVQSRPAPRPFSRDSARLAALLDMYSRGPTVSSHGGVTALWVSLQHLHPSVDWTGVSAAQVHGRWRDHANCNR